MPFRPRRAAVGTVIAVVLSLLAGAFVASQLSAFLAIEFTDKELPPEQPSTAQVIDVEPLPPLQDITVNGLDASGDPLMEAATSMLHEATTARTADEAATPVRVVVDLQPDPDAHPEGYQIDTADTDTTDADTVLTVTAADRRGAARGLFRIADAIAAGHPWDHAATDGIIEPELEDRFVDTGAVGVQPDEDAYRAQDDYQHSSGALEEVVLTEAPYVDLDELARAEAEWREFIDHVVSYGYNGVLVPGFLEYVNFDQLGDGYQIYDADSHDRARHEAMREHVGAMWRYAHDMGMKVVFKTDMMALTGPLEEYLQTETGLGPADEHLWEVYRAGLDELLTEFDWADGVMIRIGEAGSIYNHEGWDYYSELMLTDAADVRTMLTMASEVAAGHEATVYFRTWSVGVGDVGDMHTNPETYDDLMADVDLDNLVVSTKFVMGDFDSYLPLNPTFDTGSESRLVELQGRREFEVFSAIPNDVGPAHQSALREFSAGEGAGDGGGASGGEADDGGGASGGETGDGGGASGGETDDGGAASGGAGAVREGAGDDGELTGLWMWTQDGGPQRAGPMTLYLKEGLWELYDLNVYTGGRLGWDVEADLDAATGDWIRRSFTDDPQAAAAVGQVLELSRTAILDGLYIRPYAEQQVFGLGLEPPPMMWIFKWDIVSGDTASLSAVYHASRGQVDEGITAGEEAIATAEQMREIFAEVPLDSFYDARTHEALAESLDYQVDLYTTLQTFRVAFLHYYEWLDTGSAEARAAWQDAVGSYHAAVAAHEQRWTGNLDLPPFSFFSADTGIAHAERGPAVQVVAWALLALSVGGLILVPGLRAGALMPWRVHRVVDRPSRGHRAAVIAIPVVAVVASRIAHSGALSWWYPVVTLGSIALLVFVVWTMLRQGRRGADGFWLWSVIGGVLLLRTAILTAALSVRGPGAYWYRFWTDELARGIYVTAAFAAFAYLFIAIIVVLRTAYGLRLRQGVGAVLLGIAVVLAGLGWLLTAAGLEHALTTINDELAVLPQGLSRILGLTVHLGIPDALPRWLLTAGAVLASVGAILAMPWRRRSAATPRARL